MRYLKGAVVIARHSKTKKKNVKPTDPVIPGSPVHRLLQLIAKSIVKKYEPDDAEQDRGKN
ncbi:hypothetical protein [Gimesia maris]|uniref:hypothetical protein n=1 Tax=Gimesia maris TaxID=122 RepID=UPI00241E3E52|nr:hypothetical protein [Gimesia maris]|tara:strand:- start:4425 stop:4607 length:183 start_codon:yes stop_codon:yes gene_type:complete